KAELAAYRRLLVSARRYPDRYFLPDRRAACGAVVARSRRRALSRPWLNPDDRRDPRDDPWAGARDGLRRGGLCRSAARRGGPRRSRRVHRPWLSRRYGLARPYGRAARRPA